MTVMNPKDTLFGPSEFGYMPSDYAGDTLGLLTATILSAGKSETSRYAAIVGVLMFVHFRKVEWFRGS